MAFDLSDPALLPLPKHIDKNRATLARSGGGSRKRPMVPSLTEILKDLVTDSNEPSNAVVELLLLDAIRSTVRDRTSAGEE